MLRLAASHYLGTPDDEVVQQHAADYGEDHAEVEGADPAHSLAADVSRERRIDVHFGGSEFFGDAGVTLAAGSGEVGAVDRRSRVAGREDAVRAVAAGAVGNYL